jgi:hypothetical protein
MPTSGVSEADSHASSKSVLYIGLVWQWARKSQRLSVLDKGLA